MKSEIINGLMPILSDKTGRVPIILPIVMGIKTHTKEDDNNSKKDVQSKKVINKKEIPIKINNYIIKITITLGMDNSYFFIY